MVNNSDDEKVKQLLSINDLQPVLEALKKYLQVQYEKRLSEVVLFGSYARQQATRNSDVDVLVVLEGAVHSSTEIERTSEFVAQLCLEHDLVISRFFLPKSRYQAENSPLLRNIRKEGISI
ncbi:MAG: nucleotidyltransferase domain-containing protein [Cyanobacteria bacterium J06627_28]